MVAAPLRHWPRFWRSSPPPLHCLFHPSPPFSSLVISSHFIAISQFGPHLSSSSSSFCMASSSSSSSLSRAVGFQCRGLVLPRSVAVDDESDEDSEPEGVDRKSRNQKKREAKKAVKWGMDLALFSPDQIKRILRVASLEKEVFDALMLVKKLGPDVKEGKRRQYNYIGRLLRDVEPELMDALIQASRDKDNNKFQALAAERACVDEDGEEEEEETDSEICQDCADTAMRWFDGLVYKDTSITNEVYSLHNVDFDRQELRKLVRQVQIIDEAETGENLALTEAKNSLTRFLRRLSRQMLSGS